MAFKIEGKEMYPSFFSQCVVGHCTLSGKAWQACAQRTEKNHFHTTSAVSHQVYVHALLDQHL